MNRENDLRAVSDQVLSGLVADESLKQSILRKAAGVSTPETFHRFRTLPVFCALLTVMLVSVILLNRLDASNPVSPGKISVFAAGSEEENDSDLVLPEVRNDASSAFPGNPDQISGMTVSNGKIRIPADSYHVLAELIATEAVETEATIPEVDYIISFSMQDGSEIVYQASEPYLISGRCFRCPAFFERLKDLEKQ